MKRSEKTHDTSRASHLDHLQALWSTGLERAEFEAVWIAAGDTRNYFQDDHGPAFKPNPYFTQWVEPEYAQPGAQLLIRPGERPLLFFPQPEDYWHVVASAPDHLSELVEIRTFASDDALQKACASELKDLTRAAYIGEPRQDNETLGAANPAELLDFMDFHRARKTEFELGLMRTASEVGCRGHVAAAAAFHGEGSEFDIHMAYLTASGQTDLSVPYGNIIALNEHGALLHYHGPDPIYPNPSRSLLIDAGGNHAGYASDITRTHVKDGAEHDEFRALIDLMQAHQDAIIGEIRPGLPFSELNDYMHQNLARVLVDSGLVQGSPDAVYESGLTRTFCPHGLGHLLGIQVHDVGGHLGDDRGTPAPPSELYPMLRFTRAVERDHVFTIEPGLYFIDLLLSKARETHAEVNWDLVDRLSPYGGIRIEDNVRVLDRGVENLTRDAFGEVTHP